ncbi:MAG: AraC family ligand binding domain-containing protein, partial [Candidatus Ornithomonoglobus sp.]
MNNFVFSIFPSENFIDLGLYQFGWERCKPAHSFGPAARNHYLFHYVISGTGTLMAQDSNGVTQTYHIKSRQGFMIFPGQITTYVADTELPWEYTWVEFDGLRVKGIIESAGITKDSPVYRAHSKDLREEMAREMLYIKDNKEASPFHLIGHLYLFLDYLLRSAAAPSVPNGSKLRDFYVHEAVEYIEKNFQNDISVESIAAVCGLNRSYFGKIFKETMGKSPQEFLMDYRMI